MGQMKGLSETEADVQAELAEIEAELKALQAKREDIESLINEKLRPKADELQAALEKYQVYIRLKHEVSVIDSFQESWMSDLRQLPPENSSELKYHPKEYFNEEFLRAMDCYAHEILEECHYENLSSARFNLSDFDIEVNGGKKSTNHGKGYRAFLNTVVTLIFRKYLCNDAKYNPGLLIIDSDLLHLYDEATTNFGNAQYVSCIDNCRSLFEGFFKKVDPVNNDYVRGILVATGETVVENGATLTSIKKIYTY